LPGLSNAGWFNQAPSAPAPLPPRGIDETGAGTAADRGGQRNNGGGGLDFWLLDRLFGRR
jgi:hypothetical protein